MDYTYNNPFILAKDEYPHLQGLVHKIDKGDQSYGIKLIMSQLISLLSRVNTGIKNNDKAKLTRLYNEVIEQTHPCVDPTTLIRAGLDDTNYYAKLKMFLGQIQSASQLGIEKIKLSPLMQCISYICHETRWNNWKTRPNSNLDKATVLSGALACQIKTKDEICIFDIFSMLDGTVEGKDFDIQRAKKAGDIFVEHLKSLPLFKENYVYSPNETTFCAVPDEDDNERID